MNTTLKLSAVGGLLLAGSLSFSQSALGALPGACPASQTLTAFAALGATGCVDQDKLYAYISSTLPDSADNYFVEISTENINQANEFHNFSINPDPNQSTPGEYTFAYSIAVTDPLLRQIVAVSLTGDISAAAKDVKIIKEVFSDAAMSNLVQTATIDGNGPTDGPKVVVGTQFWVKDTIRIDQDDVGGQTGTLNSFTNTWTQKNLEVPEPASLALLGIGLAAFGAARRRKAA